ncbi:aminotransferase class V-fold PLP-dependent enzyme [Nocardia bovistercoris]|uniref:Aminotransferase class V-fold PLP-dependent enzyme n=1 Tax=Nocardia bovistercoris TaxID=2785916 RepID=A0A931IF10_9NOCA|nr:aminotransferase class V-fold PLP-dependent enzyme [Nocardia bovistercoris]MBH0779175.1 aminotransferase class V-fold PLP-dependent enzyme [Nocardia bovistercoris]
MRSSAPGPHAARPPITRQAPGAAPSRAAVRALFPALAESREVYLDSAATTQKPEPVVRAVTEYHASRTANADRGAYPWATGLGRRVAEIRARTARFIGADDTDEVVFTSGATAALNAVAMSWGLAELADGDQILYSPDGHSSNVYPWHHLRQLLARFGRRIELVPYRTNAFGEADTADILAKVTARTRLITTAHVHHVFGGRTTLEELRGLIDPAILLCFDCSQSGGHQPVDVAELGADFAIFAAHKMFGAPGTGILYCRRRVHDRLLPFLPGGNSGVRLTDAGLVATGMPDLLEGGTHNLPGILALGAALEVIDSFGVDAIAGHDRDLTIHLVERLRRVPGLRFLPGPAYAPCAVGYGIVSFTLTGISSADVGFVLSELGFLVRTGAHCTVPDGDADVRETDSVRVSTHIYTTFDEIDRFVRCVTTIAEEVS